MGFACFALGHNWVYTHRECEEEFVEPKFYHTGRDRFVLKDGWIRRCVRCGLMMSKPGDSPALIMSPAWETRRLREDLTKHWAKHGDNLPKKMPSPVPPPPGTHKEFSDAPVQRAMELIARAREAHLKDHAGVPPKLIYASPAIVEAITSEESFVWQLTPVQKRNLPGWTVMTVAGPPDSAPPVAPEPPALPESKTKPPISDQCDDDDEMPDCLPGIPPPGSLGDLIFRFECLHERIKGGNQEKALDGITGVLVQFVDYFGTTPVAAQMFPVLEVIKNHIRAGELQEAEAGVLVLLAKLRRVESDSEG